MSKSKILVNLLKKGSQQLFEIIDKGFDLVDTIMDIKKQKDLENQKEITEPEPSNEIKKEETK